MRWVIFRRGTVLHRWEDAETTLCGIEHRGAKPVTTAPRRIGRCLSCERVASMRSTLHDSWKANEPVNRMALIRECVEIRAKARADGR
jgi:hypothetical protein